MSFTGLQELSVQHPSTLYCGVSDYDIVVLGDRTAPILQIKSEALCSSFTLAAIKKYYMIS